MNTLSFLIYLAEVSDGAKVALIIVALLLIVSAPFFALISSDTYDEKEQTEWKRRTKSAVTYACAAAVLAIFIPSSKTLYLIAASEMGENALNSERGQKLVTILDQKLDELADEATQ